MDASQLLKDTRLIPVVVMDDAEQAAPLAGTLRDAGVTAIEITLRTSQALAAIEAVAKLVPDILVGAGSVTEPGQFAQVREAGAQFAVSPGQTQALLDAAQMAYLPGAATASECLALSGAGYRLVKFFPAAAAGGTAALSSLSGPLPHLRFCPTGGVTADNARHYLALDCVQCVGGSWFVPKDLLSAGAFDSIARLARQAVEICSV